MGTCMAMEFFNILGEFFLTNMHFLILDAHAIK
jgi:hypothetical protein